MLTLHRHNSWSSQLSKDAKRIVHGCLQLIGGIFVIAGSFLGLAEAEMTINTAHGICGKFDYIKCLGPVVYLGRKT